MGGRCRLIIGIDDTDSKRGMCTTYVAVKALREVESLGALRCDYPRLVRLNPNCPYKTRGNAAIALVVDIDESDVEVIKEAVIRTVERNAEISAEGTDPGIVFLQKRPAERLVDFYWKAVRRIVNLEEAKSLCEGFGVDYYTLKGERGLIGALAAASADERTLTTYELLAYRAPENIGRPRRIDEESVKIMDRNTWPYTFDNYDYETGSVRITPHTPCPVLLGIRAITARHAEEAFKMLKINEPVEFYETFKTNQATDIHYVTSDIGNLMPNTSAIVKGVISSRPRIMSGGHVFVEMSDGLKAITLAAYEPTKGFRSVIANLIPGDEVVAYGAVKVKPEGLTINLEKIRIVKLVEKTMVAAPNCPKCSRRMTSAGRGKGYKCKLCKFVDRTAKPSTIKVERAVSPGMYEVVASARRHLARPIGLIL